MFGHWGNYYLTKIVSLKKNQKRKMRPIEPHFPKQTTKPVMKLPCNQQGFTIITICSTNRCKSSIIFTFNMLTKIKER